MKNKKLISLLLAVVLCMALAVPAFADDVEYAPDGTLASEYKTNLDSYVTNGDATHNDDLMQGKDMIATGQVRVPIIALVFPTDFKVILNPYGMTVKVQDDYTVYSRGKDVEGSTSKQILSAPYFVYNNSECALDVYAKVYNHTSATSFTVQNKTFDASKATAKQIFAVVEFQEASVSVVDGELKPTVAWADEINGNIANNQLVVPVDRNAAPSSNSGKTILQLSAPGEGAYNALAIKVDGIASETPTTPWDSNDVFSVQVVYNFKPATASEE